MARNSTFTGRLIASTVASTPLFSVSGGALPPGISLSSAGAFSGSATTPGSYTFAVTASAGQSAVTQSFTLIVNPSALAGTVQTVSVHRTGDQTSRDVQSLSAARVLRQLDAIPGGVSPARHQRRTQRQSDIDRPPQPGGRRQRRAHGAGHRDLPRWVHRFVLVGRRRIRELAEVNVVQEIVPYVDSACRTLARRERRVMQGSPWEDSVPEVRDEVSGAVRPVVSCTTAPCWIGRACRSPTRSKRPRSSAAAPRRSINTRRTIG